MYARLSQYPSLFLIPASYETFSLEGAIQGGYYHSSPSDQCFCNMYLDGSLVPNGGACVPQENCASCSIEESGVCSQSYGDSTVPGV